MLDYAECSVIAKRLRFLANDLENAYGAKEGESLFADAAGTIEDLLAAAPRWISVEERLPEKHTEVLICTEDYGKNELGFANTAVWDGSEWRETWKRKEYIPYVSHWMPLPEPPKEELNEV